jgi:hypothetical protein
MDEQLVGDSDHVELARLVTEIAWRIDHGKADSVHELFVDDGEMDLGQTTLRGRDAIGNWGRLRVAATSRTRHVCANMRFVARGADGAEGITLLIQYTDAGDQKNWALPRVVGEDRDRFVRTDRGWRFVSRNFDQVFVRQEA